MIPQTMITASSAGGVEAASAQGASAGGGDGAFAEALTGAQSVLDGRDSRGAAGSADAARSTGNGRAGEGRQTQSRQSDATTTETSSESTQQATAVDSSDDVEVPVAEDTSVAAQPDGAQAPSAEAAALATSQTATTTSTGPAGPEADVVPAVTPTAQAGAVLDLAGTAMAAALQSGEADGASAAAAVEEPLAAPVEAAADDSDGGAATVRVVPSDSDGEEADAIRGNGSNSAGSRGVEHRSAQASHQATSESHTPAAVAGGPRGSEQAQQALAESNASTTARVVHGLTGSAAQPTATEVTEDGSAATGANGQSTRLPSSVAGPMAPVGDAGADASDLAPARSVASNAGAAVQARMVGAEGEVPLPTAGTPVATGKGTDPAHLATGTTVGDPVKAHGAPAGTSTTPAAAAVLAPGDAASTMAAVAASASGTGEAPTTQSSTPTPTPTTVQSTSTVVVGNADAPDTTTTGDGDQGGQRSDTGAAQSGAPTLRASATAEEGVSAQARTAAATAAPDTAQPSVEPPTTHSVGGTRVDGLTTAASRASDVAQTAGLARAIQARIENIADQLSARLRLSHAAGGSEVQLSLRPRSLGDVTVQMTVRDGTVAATVVADRVETGRLLQQNTDELRRTLQEQGLTIQEFTVDVRGGDAQGSPARGMGEPAGSRRSGPAAVAGLADGASTGDDRTIDPEDLHDGNVSVLI